MYEYFKPRGLESSQAEIMAKSIVGITKVFMIIIGLWKLQLFQHPLMLQAYRVYSWGVHVVLCLFGVSSTFRFFQLLSEENPNFTIVYSNLTINIIIYLMSASVIIFLRSRIPEVFAEILLEEAKALSSRDEDIRKSYLGQTGYYQFTSICQIFGTVSSAVVFVCLNVYNKANGLLQDQEVFMYQLWFPFDPDKYFGVVLFGNLLVLFVGVSCNVASRVIIQTLIIFANSQLRILQIRLRKVFLQEQHQLKRLVEKHQKLIRFVEFLNDSLKNLIWMEYMINTVSVAAGLLHIITASTVLERVYSSFHFVLLIVQVFVLAWSANEVNIQSTNVAHAAFESNWIDQNEKTKKIILIIIMRAQKPLVLKIGKFRPMNAESAVITMKGAYTYASVMLQKYS